jgi:ribose 5-phosphate isomerase A
VTIDAEKRCAAEAAAELVETGMTVGLGTGTTIAHLLPILARRALAIRCVATSPMTERIAREVGLTITALDGIDRLDLAIDGADQVAPDFWLVKGGGGAHTREKIVAVTSERFIVIVDSTKLVDALSPPLPLELAVFGLASTIRRLAGPVQVRPGSFSPDGGALADLDVSLVEPAIVAAQVAAVPGVVAHGLFPPATVSGVFVGHGRSVELLEPRHRSQR